MDEFGVHGHELIRRTATEHGNGAHVYVPKDWLGAHLAIVRTSETDTNQGVAALVDNPFAAGGSPYILTLGDYGSGKDYSVNRRALRWGAASEARTVIFCDFSGERRDFIEMIGGEHVVVDESFGVLGGGQAKIEREAVTDLLEDLSELEEGEEYEGSNGAPDLSLQEGGFTYLDLQEFDTTDHSERALIGQAILAHLSKPVTTSTDETVVVIDDAHSFYDPATADMLERRARHWRHHDAAMWFVSDSPNSLIASEQNTERPGLVDLSQTVEFFATGIADETAAAFDLTEQQTQFLRAEAAADVANGGHSEGLIRRPDVPGWSRFKATSSPIEDDLLPSWTNEESK